MRKIIDSHAHLGDILYGKNITFKQNVVKKDHHNYLEILEENMLILPEELQNIDEKVFSESMLNEEQARNGTATLQNMSRSLDENGISKVWILPVLPHVGFEEVLAASKLDDRIVPFTSIDFSLGDSAGEKLIQDVKNGAQGLKIHPILQKKSLLSQEVSEALRMWEKTGKPVVCHTYPFSYYHEEEIYRNSPEFGSNYDFLELVEKFPKINFIGAHAGGPFNFPEMLEGAHLKNLFVDTSFQGVETVKLLVKKIGADKVLFGTDWPWGYQTTPIKVIVEACEGEQELENKIFFENAERLMEGNHGK